MAHFDAPWKRVALFILALAAAALACNLPGGEPATPTNPPPVVTQPATVQAQPTLGAPETLPALVASATAGAASPGSGPTFTPIEPPTLAPTHTPSSTPALKPTATRGARPGTPRPTSTSNQQAGPLSFSYYIEWRLKNASAKQAIATVTITAKGGGGGYQYFRDEIPVDGPVFEYEWRTCAGNPGSFRVTAADGQTLKEDYFANPPCPTPTPTP